MGTFLDGYGEAGYDHEGYAAQVLDDGSITGTYSGETRPRMIGQVVAACGCGWAGTTRYPARFDAQAEALALGEWEQAHARPVLDRDRQTRARRLHELLGALADAHRAQLTTGPRPELLDRTLRSLAQATILASELRDQTEPNPRAEQ